MNLSGKVAVVTGSGRGLGLAYATELARGGASVVINDVDGAVAASAVKAITEGGGAAVAEVVPVGTSAAAQALVDRAVSTFGRLDVLVNNAGILRDATLWKMTDEQFDAVISTHLRGTFTCTRAAAIRMREQGEGGRIICVGSPTGQLGNFGQGNYAAAKAGIVGMVRTWALELARAQITVNAIVPVAATAMTETIPFLKPYVEALHAGEPLPVVRPSRAGFRVTAGRRWAGRLPRLGRRRRHQRAGDRHRRRPAGAVVAPERGRRRVRRGQRVVARRHRRGLARAVRASAAAGRTAVPGAARNRARPP